MSEYRDLVKAFKKAKNDYNSIMVYKIGMELCAEVEILSSTANRLRQERDHWKANHDNMTAQNELLRTRLDLDANDPATQAAQRFRIIAERDALQQRVGELEADRDEYRAGCEWRDPADDRAHRERDALRAKLAEVVKAGDGIARAFPTNDQLARWHEATKGIEL